MPDMGFSYARLLAGLILAPLSLAIGIPAELRGNAERDVCNADNCLRGDYT